MKCRVFLILLMVFLSSQALAEPTFTPIGIPSNLHVYSTSGSTYFNHIKVDNEHGCAGNGYYISSDHPRYDTIVAIVLAAQLTKKNIMVRFDGCINIPRDKDGNVTGKGMQGKVIGVYLKE